MRRRLYRFWVRFVWTLNRPDVPATAPDEEAWWQAIR